MILLEKIKIENIIKIKVLLSEKKIDKINSLSKVEVYDYLYNTKKDRVFELTFVEKDYEKFKNEFELKEKFKSFILIENRVINNGHWITIVTKDFKKIVEVLDLKKKDVGAGKKYHLDEKNKNDHYRFFVTNEKMKNLENKFIIYMPPIVSKLNELEVDGELYVEELKKSKTYKYLNETYPEYIDKLIEFTVRKISLFKCSTIEEKDNEIKKYINSCESFIKHLMMLEEKNFLLVMIIDLYKVYIKLEKIEDESISIFEEDEKFNKYLIEEIKNLLEDKNFLKNISNFLAIDEMGSLNKREQIIKIIKKTKDRLKTVVLTKESLEKFFIEIYKEEKIITLTYAENINVDEANILEIKTEFVESEEEKLFVKLIDEYGKSLAKSNLKQVLKFEKMLNDKITKSLLEKFGVNFSNWILKFNPKTALNKIIQMISEIDKKEFERYVIENQYEFDEILNLEKEKQELKQSANFLNKEKSKEIQNILRTRKFDFYINYTNHLTEIKNNEELIAEDKELNELIENKKGEEYESKTNNS